MPRAERRARRLARDERGQTFPFVVTLLLALFLVVGTVINVGQAVNRRIFLQMLADAGAFTGATEMARGMNTLAKLNGRIQQAWGGLTYATMGFTVTACLASDTGVAGYGTVVGATSTLIALVNRGYGRRATDEAANITRYNSEDLFPGERLSMGERDGATGLASPRPTGSVVNLEQVPAGTAAVYPALSPARTFATWTCLSPSPQMRSAGFPLWYQKRGSNPIAFVWVVKAPAVRARFFDSFFGPSLIPEMTAAAAAKPVGGEIKEAKAEYVAKFVPVRELLGSIWDARRQRARPVLH